MNYTNTLLGDDKWMTYIAKASETNIIDQEELDAAKAQMGDTKYRQEFECDWIANIEGSIYGDIIKNLEDRKQLTRIAYDPRPGGSYSLGSRSG